MKTRIVSIIALSALSSVGCGDTVKDRPPALPESEPELVFGTQCACDINLSSTAAFSLFSDPAKTTTSVNVDACLFEPGEPTLEQVNAVCARTEQYVQSAIEDIATAKTGFGGAICESGVAWIESVTCAPTSVSPDPNDADVRFGGLAKLTPMCEGAYEGTTVECSFIDSSENSYCKVNSLDPQTQFNAGTCANCNAVKGCGLEPVRVERQPLGNADDPPLAPPFGPHGPLSSFVVGRKDGSVDDGRIYIKHKVSGCVGFICASDTEDDSSNLWGDVRVYGGPCEGASCEVALEMNLAGSSMNFDFGIDTPLGDITFESHSISDLTIYLGSGEYSVTVDPSGRAVVPAHQFQYKIYWKDNGTSKQAIGWFDKEVEFEVDWASRTISVDSLSLDLGLDETKLLDLSASFGDSLFEKLNGICPAPELAESSSQLALACTADANVKFSSPNLVMGCVDTPATITGEIVEANGAVLPAPIPIVDGEADAPRGSVVVLWTVTDSRGRTDQTRQTFETMVRPTLAASESLDMGDHFSVVEPSGVDAAVLNFGSGQTILNVEGYVGELSSVSRVEFRDRSGAKLLLSPVAYLPQHNQISVADQQFLAPPSVPFPEYPVLVVGSEPVFVGPEQIRTLTPGSYGNVTVHGRGRLILTPGEYSFAELDMHSTSHLDIENGLGEVNVVVSGATRLQSSFDYATGNTAGFTLTYLGTETVYLESQFKGTLLAPNGTLNFRALNGLRHEGEFYAKKIKTEGGAKVLHVPAACE